jgi:AP-1-like transcription factor
VKDLEIKLNSLEAHSSTLLTDNERLKRELDKLVTQNEILRATTTPLNPFAHMPPNLHGHLPPPLPESPIPGPLTYSPSAFHEALTGGHPSTANNRAISHRIQVSATTGERLLATGATWDLIQSHELFRKGMVDIGEVCSRLKDRALCDGNGPAFAEGEILRAIEESVGGAGDELI